MFTNPLKTSFKIISQIFGCCFVISGVWLLEKFLLQAFSIYFHKKVYSERLVKSSHNAYLLTKLAKARKALQRKESTPDVLSPASSKFKSAIDKVKDGVERGAKGFLNISNVTFGYKIENKAGVKHFGEPGRFALKLFRTMVKDNEDGLVSLNNFMPFFSTLDEAVEAFNLFDSDGNGDVSLAEMRECISGIYDEYDFLETSLRNSSQAIEKMDAILKTVMFVILIFVCLGIFNVDTTQFIAIFIALWAGSLFALSGTVKNLVESIIFLFLTHPYGILD